MGGVVPKSSPDKRSWGHIVEAGCFLVSCDLEKGGAVSINLLYVSLDLNYELKHGYLYSFDSG